MNAEAALTFSKEFARAIDYALAHDAEHLPRADSVWDAGGWQAYDDLTETLGDLRTVNAHDSALAIASNLALATEDVLATLLDLSKALDWGPGSPFRGLHWSLRDRKLARLAAQEATQAAESAKKAAGLSAAASLSGHFATLARTERRIAMAFRAGTFLIILVGASVSAAMNIQSSTAVPTVVQHVSTLLATAALSFYSARLASGHMVLARWAATIDVQLMTLDAYCEGLRDETAETDLRLAFGHRAFALSPPDTNAAAETVPNLIDAVTHLSALVRWPHDARPSTRSEQPRRSGQQQRSAD